MPEPRIAPLPADEWDERVRELMPATLGGGERPLNIFTTLARHPDLFRAWLRFGGVLLTRGLLPARDRELAILRVAHLCDAAYERFQHERIARAIGVSDEEIEATTRSPADGPWTETERAVLAAADELHERAGVSDETWAKLAAAYDEPRLIELLMLIGQYHMVAFALNSLGVQVEDEATA